MAEEEATTLELLAEERAHPVPTLPQHSTKEEQETRAFDVSVARTSYNWMHSYLPRLPFSADIPKGESFTLAYQALVAGPLMDLGKNFGEVVMAKLEQELVGDIIPDDGLATMKHVEQSLKNLREQLDGFSGINIKKDIEAMVELFEALAAVPREIEHVIEGIAELPEDIKRIFTTMEKLSETLPEQGATAFLRDTLYDLLRHDDVDESYLHPKGWHEYDELYPALPVPAAATLEQKPWMGGDYPPAQQDWYFGWMQIAGFNTTQLKGVKVGDVPDGALSLADLQKKMPITDELFRAVVGEGAPSLEEAAKSHRLYVADYWFFDGASCDVMHGHQRYLVAPIALFYWNPESPEGYPPKDLAAEGVLQPVAIQLGQRHDAEETPIFTPRDRPDALELTGVTDPDGIKWQAAKWQVLHACAVQHEAVAHLADCHLIVEPFVVAMHRSMAASHPLHILLKPHFRFTIDINASARHSLVIPGGVVASVLSTSIGQSMEIIAQNWNAYRFDDRNPKNDFARRGLADLPDFPFRDDTRLLWDAILHFVTDYVDVYYDDDDDVKQDWELQGFIHEVTSPDAGGFKGMDGLVNTSSDDRPKWEIHDKAYLCQLVAQVIYTASALHASVNFAQYDMMSYIPVVSGTAYRREPTATGAYSKEDFLRTMPPIDVALYQLSFGYLLSAVQFDRLGYYERNPRQPYFQDHKVKPAIDHFRAKLAAAESAIRKKNLARPVPYEVQLPSYVPNSISI